MDATKFLAPSVGTTAACAALGVARASFYRRAKPRLEPAPRPTPARALSMDERQVVLDTLNSQRFVDAAPATVYATLLDDKQYLCSVRTMYRLLEDHVQLRERRNQLRHLEYRKPELLATAPNQVWSWDITKLKGSRKWLYFQLYVILDVFSRYVTGWLLAATESAGLASRLIHETCEKQHITPGQLTIHADRGTSMTSKSVAQLMADLEVTKSHSRPHVSDDNPFSEAHFKTLKYRPDFPERFGSLEDAQAFCRHFFRWYNHHHRHSAIGYLTPAAVHYGTAADIIAERQLVLDAAYAQRPDRFVGSRPQHPVLPTEVWINPPVRKRR